LTLAPSQRQAAEAGLEGVVGRPLRRRKNPGQGDLESRGVAAAGAVAESRPAMAKYFANGTGWISTDLV
jgi:hypothetical protein